MKKGRFWLRLLPILIGFGSILYLLSAQFLFSPSSFDRIEEGMSVADVESILGAPTWTGPSILVEKQGRWIEASEASWMWPDGSITVAYDKNGRLSYKSHNVFRRSFFERVRAWLGL